MTYLKNHISSIKRRILNQGEHVYLIHMATRIIKCYLRHPRYHKSLYLMILWFITMATLIMIKVILSRLYLHLSRYHKSYLLLYLMLSYRNLTHTMSPGYQTEVFTLRCYITPKCSGVYPTLRLTQILLYSNKARNCLNTTPVKRSVSNRLKRIPRKIDYKFHTHQLDVKKKDPSKFFYWNKVSGRKYKSRDAPSLKFNK
ncbi:Hypothetical protein CINCED_3A000936, partial [Cinara cedri]